MLSSWPEEIFISQIVFTLKKDQLKNFGSDSQALNKPIHKNEYQMSNIELLRYIISQHLTDTKTANKHGFQP